MTSPSTFACRANGEKIGFDRFVSVAAPFGAPDCTDAESCAAATPTATNSNAIREMYVTSALYLNRPAAESQLSLAVIALKTPDN